MYAPALKQIDVGFNKMEKTFKVKQDCIVKNPLIMEIMKMNPAGDVEYPNQTYMSFIDGINKAQQNLKNLYAPWILVQGELDKVVHVSSIIYFIDINSHMEQYNQNKSLHQKIRHY